MVQAKQKYLGTKGLIVFIAILSAFVPLSTDLYLPALPGMSAYFGTGADRINLTLSAFFIFYALGTLIWGPLSDHYGRKPILITGLGLYVIASAFCALMRSVDGLILCRIFQALGGSAAGAVATAIVKDEYSGKKRESVLAIVQSMVLISPAVAPVLGAFMLKITSWRGVFWNLTGIGLIALVFSLLFQNPSPNALLECCSKAWDISGTYYGTAGLPLMVFFHWDPSLLWPLLPLPRMFTRMVFTSAARCTVFIFRSMPWG